MKTHIQKWGNSLALRIPKTLADEAGLHEDSPVEITLVNGQMMLTPIHAPEYALDDLLAQITDHNRHGEIDTGLSTGNEVW